MKMRHTAFFVVLVLFFGAAFSSAADLRVRPHKINPNGKKSKMKAEILGLENPKAVNIESILLNGVEPLKVRVTPRKVIARFYRKEVLSTLGELEKGQEYVLTISYGIGNSPQPLLTDTIKIVGKKKTPGPPAGN